MYASFLTSDFDMLNPFSKAALNGDLEEMRFLADMLPQVELCRPTMLTRETPIQLLIKSGDHIDALTFLVKELGQSVGQLSLDLAVRYNRPQIFAFLLNEVNPIDVHSLYRIALHYGNTAFIKILQDQNELEKVEIFEFLDVAVEACNLKSLCYLRRTKQVSLDQIKEAYEAATPKEKYQIARTEAWVAREPILFALSKGQALEKLKPAFRRLIVELL